MFTLLIIGADANAYYMARCFHELTGRKPIILPVVLDIRKQ